MPDLRWTMPVAHWSSWSPDSATKPDIGFIEPMMRRRLSSLSKAALKVAHGCANGKQAVRMVFASRHGELRRTTDILRNITAAEPVSPNAFSLSVLNAMSGIYGISRGDRSPATAVSAGPESLGYALLEAYVQHMDQPSMPVLVVYADEPVDALYGSVENEIQEGALAILVDANGAQGHLECAVSDMVDANNADLRPSTQSEALLRCLDTHQCAAWRSADVNWQWKWHDRAA
jgi:hypothetical protein